ncbi:MAG: DUF5518 domain-containing protein [Halorhabdus sp.]
MADRGGLVNSTIGAVLTVAAVLVTGFLGSMVTVLKSTVVLAPVVGGIAAGYRQGGDVARSLKVGAFTGFLAASLVLLSVVPMVLFTLAYSPLNAHETLVVGVKVGAGLSYVVLTGTAGGLLGGCLLTWSR